MKLLERSFGILRVIADAPEGVGVSVIAARMGLAKSTTSRILSALEGQGAVVRSAENRFTIGSLITQLIAKQPFLQTLTASARPYLQQLVAETGEAAALCVQDGDQVLYVDQVQSQQAVQVLDWTGKRFPLHVLAAGKVFLAYGSAEFLDDYLSKPLVAFTDKSIVSAEKLRSELDQVRTAGVAQTDEEFAEAIVGYAAPLFNAQRECIAALNVFGPKFRFADQSKQALVRQRLNVSAHVASKP